MEALLGALLERDAELAAVRQLLVDADGGNGAVLVVEGPPGIGKTGVLSAAREAAAEMEFHVLATRAGELERELAWDVARGLLEPALRALPDAERNAVLDGAARLSLAVLEGAGSPAPVGPGDAVSSALHGLHWLTANLALRRPLLVAVDDVHWADTASLRWLGYISARLGELPLALVLTGRPLAAGPHQELLRSIRREARVLQLAPLSEDASTELVRRTLGQHAELGFCAACHEATAGNPFLLSQLLRELDRQQVAPLDINARRVASTGAAAVADDVAMRLGRLPEASRLLAGAIAVLGSEATLADAAALSRLGMDAAARAADALTDAQLLANEVPLRFVHPLVRTSVYEQMPAVQRARRHAEAAELLGGSDARPARIAAHLVWVEPSGDPNLTNRLREAAELALAQGAPEAAIRYTMRALAEPPSDPERPVLLHLLGRAQVATRGPAGLAALEEALAAYSDPVDRGEVALELSHSARMWGDFQRAARALRQALDDLDPDSRLGSRIEGELMNVAGCDAELLELGFERMVRYLQPGLAERVRDPGILADLAALSSAACQPREQTCALARRALAALPDTRTDPSVLVFVTHALACAGALAEASAAWDPMIDAVRESGSALGLGFALAWRAVTALRMGAVREAEADATAAEAIYRPWGSPIAPVFLAEALIERGQLDDADRLLHPEEASQAVQEQILSPGVFDWIPILHARGRLRLAQGRPDDALQDLLDEGRRCEALRYYAPGLYPWRSTAARALLQLGDRNRARELVAEELQLARAAGVPHAIGTARCVGGLIEGGDEGIEQLREAVDELGGSEARLEHTRALCDLGARLRREGKRTGAELALREALDLADRCGATALATRAREELIAAGARPRRSRMTGPQALTASELRVARFAADGRTNREIAQALFITLRTVETHLGHAYQKLDIRSRRELPQALGEAGPGHGQSP